MAYEKNIMNSNNVNTQKTQNVFSYVKMLREMMAQLEHSNKVNYRLLCLFITNNDNVKWCRYTGTIIVYSCIVAEQIPHPYKKTS